MRATQLSHPTRKKSLSLYGACDKSPQLDYHCLRIQGKNDLSILTMKRTIENLPTLTAEDYDGADTANDAKGEDSDLELGFRFLEEIEEEIEEEAEKERLASLNKRDWKPPLENLDVPNAYTFFTEEKITPARKVRNRSSKEVKPVPHDLLT